MVEKKKDEAFRFLVPVDVLPEGPTKKGIYDNILEEFIKSGLKYAEVKDIGKEVKNVWQMLNYKKKRVKISNVDIIVRNKKVYLKRVDPPNQENLTTQTSHEVAVLPRHRFSNNEAGKTSSSLKPSIDTIDLGNTIIIKLRCPKCNALNAKDTHRCRDCGSVFYESEQEFHDFTNSVERLENELNQTRNRI